MDKSICVKFPILGLGKLHLSSTLNEKPSHALIRNAGLVKIIAVPWQWAAPEEALTDVGHLWKPHKSTAVPLKLFWGNETWDTAFLAQ